MRSGGLLKTLTLRGYYWLFILVLAAPILVLFLMSVKDSEFIGFPLKGFTLDWYRAALQNPEFHRAVMTSLVIAISSTIAALILGTWAALAFRNLPPVLRLPALFVLMIPLGAPGVIAAISLRVFVFDIGLGVGLFSIILSHTIHSVPFVAMMISARLGHMPPNLISASRDLGASPFVTFWLITMPFLKPSLLGATIFAMLLSLDDFNRSFFLGGFEKPIPILVYQKLSSGVTPELSAFSCLVLILTIGFGFIGDRALRRSGERK